MSAKDATEFIDSNQARGRAGRWARSFLSLIVRLALLYSAVFATSWILDTLSRPQTAQTILLACATLLTISALLSRSIQLASFAGVLLFILFLISLRYLPEQTVVYLLGLASVVVLELAAMFSAIVGKCKWESVQHVCMGIAIVFPPASALLWLVTSSTVLYWFGVICSVAACCFNILFNKSAFSVGVPGLIRSKSLTQREFDLAHKRSLHRGRSQKFDSYRSSPAPSPTQNR